MEEMALNPLLTSRERASVGWGPGARCSLPAQPRLDIPPALWDSGWVQGGPREQFFVVSSPAWLGKHLRGGQSNSGYVHARPFLGGKPLPENSNHSPGPLSLGAVEFGAESLRAL